MDKKIQAEVKTLMKIGLPEDLALLSAGAKYGNEDVVNSVLNDLCDEQELIIQAMSGFKPMCPLALEYVPAEIIKHDQTKVLFVEMNPITNEIKPLEIPQQHVLNTAEDEPQTPVYRLPVGKT